MLLGLGSLETALAVWGSIAAALVCVVYGVVNWNKGGDDHPRKIRRPRGHSPKPKPSRH
jgi:hypothetical protein